MRAVNRAAVFGCGSQAQDLEVVSAAFALRRLMFRSARGGSRPFRMAGLKSLCGEVSSPAVRQPFVPITARGCQPDEKVLK